MILFMVGCSSSESVKPPTPTPVSGDIFLSNGQPMPAGRITFNPKDNGLPEATAEINNGSFQLTSFKKNDGVVPGDYVITVEPITYLNGTAKRVNVLVPLHYQKVATSRLNVTIKDGQQPLTIRLQ